MIKFIKNTDSLSRAIAGIKYFITSTIPANEELYEKIAVKGEYTLYYNPLSLPLGFLVNKTALNMK